MSRGSQYGYYDPVGSSQAPRTGYTYQSTSNASSYPSAATAAGFGGDQQSYGGIGFGAQFYGHSAQPSSSTSHAAAVSRSPGNQDYSQASDRSSTGQYESSSWYGQGQSATSKYDTGTLHPLNRSQVNRSPLYAGTQSTTFGQMSVPDQTSSTSNTYGSSSTYDNASPSTGTNNRYQSSTNHPTSNPPPRYNSPLHAVHAQQQNRQKQPSRGSDNQSSPQNANAVPYAQQQSRQQSASVEPSPTTVDPSQVYDNRAQLEWRARAEAERREKTEAEQAAKKAEEDRSAEEKRSVEEAKQKAVAHGDSAKNKEQQERKNEQRQKAREEKRQSKSAATALQQMASMGANSASDGAVHDEEAEMRAMFKKMREYNSKNPAMLAKLWEEERKQHLESQPPQAEKPPLPSASKSAHSRQPSGPTAQEQHQSGHQPSLVPSQKSSVQHHTKNARASQGSTQSTISRPISTSANTSLWPPHKKGALADATARWLMVLPENVGKTISQQVVFSILNSNPSYVQLCESLESLDMIFERSALARELLKAVPDGMRAPQKPVMLSTSTVGATASASATARTFPQSTDMGPGSATSSAGKARASSGLGVVAYEAPVSLSDAARDINEMHKSRRLLNGTVRPPQQSPYLGQSQTLTSGSRPLSQAGGDSKSQPPETKPDNKPPELPRAPADKEEAARKRTFGDLVDLTQDGDSDDEGPPAKKSFQQGASGPPAPSASTIARYRDPLAYLMQQPAYQPHKAFTYRPQKSQMPVADIMQPSPTVATGQILPSQVLPSHEQQSRAAPQTSSQTQPTQRKSNGPSNEQLQHSRMRGKMLVEPIMRDRVARKSRYDSTTIARDVLLATGRHPDMRGLNTHLSNMQKLLGHHGGESDSTGTRCDLSTIRWDILDPEPSTESVEEGGTTANESTSRPVSRESATAAAPTVSPTVNYEAPTSANMTLPFPRKRKKRGRKPRAMMPDRPIHSLGNGGHLQHATATSRPTTPNSAPASAPGPAFLAHVNDMAAQGTPVGYSAFRQIGPDGQAIKKKGRPLGWRKSVHSREALGLPVAHPKKEGVKLGRPTKDMKEKSLVEPQWQSFFCNWQGCKAELQNLDTLKKHLVKVHGRKMDGGKGYQCMWKGCVRQPGEGGGFADVEKWVGHVDKAHLQAVAWKQGDGPRGGSLGDSPSSRNVSSTPAYLQDRYGRSVTPIIEPTRPRSPPDQQTEAANTYATAVPLPIHPAPAPATATEAARGMDAEREATATAELEKLEEHKRIVGPLMDRQGCVLASDERRMTFLGDEDFEDEVEGSEFDDLEGAWG